MISGGERQREYQKEWVKTEKGKEYGKKNRKKYYYSEKGNNTRNTYIESLDGFITILLKTAKNSDKIKKFKEPNITKDDIKSLFEKQKGLCLYSNCPLSMKPKSNQFQASLERIDNSLGHDVENCVLIIAELQVSKSG